MRYSLVLSSFIVRLRYSVWFFSFIVYLMESASNISKYLWVLYSRRSRQYWCIKNIICFFFHFITQNVRIGGVWKDKDGWTAHSGAVITCILFTLGTRYISCNFRSTKMSKGSSSQYPTRFLFLECSDFYFFWWDSFISSVNCRFPLLIIRMAHFSMPNSILTSSLYIPTPCIRVSFFILG